MLTTGNLVRININYRTKRPVVELEIEANPEDLERYFDKNLEVMIREYKKKRSLDANAYFHVLVGKLADKMTLSKTRVKNDMICSFGQQQFLDNGVEVVIKTNIPADKMCEQEYLQCLPCGTKYENGQEVYFYKVFRGSHTYNTQEMSALIEGTVQTCKDQKVETLTPRQLKEMMLAYDQKYSAKENG